MRRGKPVGAVALGPAAAAAAVAAAWSDGAIASSIGSATAAPTPRKNVRRSMCHLRLTRYLRDRGAGRVASPHLKRDAVDHAEHQRREPAVVGLQLIDDLVDRRLVV